MNNQILFFASLLLMVSNAAWAKPNDRAPTDIEDLFKGYFRENMELSPETASSLGLTPAMGYPVNND